MTSHLIQCVVTLASLESVHLYKTALRERHPDAEGFRQEIDQVFTAFFFGVDGFLCHDIDLVHIDGVILIP